MKKSKAVIDSVLTTVFMGLLVYAAYSLWFIFYGKDSGADVHLYTVLSGTALGWFMAMFIQSVFKVTGLIKNIIAYAIPIVAGNGIFQALIWGINAKVNSTGNDRLIVVSKTFTVVFVLSAILLLAAFILRAKQKYKVLNIILAVIYFAVSCGGFYAFNQENFKALTYKKILNLIP